jgi:hypothetical protein
MLLYKPMKYSPDIPSFDPYADIIDGKTSNVNPFDTSSDVLKFVHQERQSQDLRTTLVHAVAHEALRSTVTTSSKVEMPTDPFKRDRVRLRAPEEKN